MRQTGSSILLFLFLLSVTAGLFWAGETYLWPPKPKPKPAAKPLNVPREIVGALAGGVVLEAPGFDKLPSLPAPKTVEPPKPVEAKPKSPLSLIALGDDTFYLKVLLTNRGGAVQQVVLTKFDDASRLGLEIKDEGGPRKLHLIPGFVRPWFPRVKDEPPLISLSANYSSAQHAAKAEPFKLCCEEKLLSKPSYVLLHYPSKDDPARMKPTEELTSADIDRYPLPDLAERSWDVEALEQPEGGGTWKVAFTTTLDAPYHLKLRKTFTLSPKDYDFKLVVEVEPMAGRTKGSGQFRYQIAGPIGMPIEGEWYTTTYRTVYTGWTDGDGAAYRTVDDPKTIHFKAGADETRRLGRFRYAAVGTQFFASALAIDMDEESKPWEYVRATRELTPDDVKRREEYDADKSHLFDVTFRAVSPLYDLPPGETIKHSYAVYNGPIKVMLLNGLKDDRAVDRARVDTYLTAYRLDTLTDLHSPNWFGRRADSVGWSWLLIKASNLMHHLLGYLHGLVGHWGVTIVLLTMLVKLCLFIPSRRQQTINAKMQAQIATIKPELDELQAKYGHDFMLHNQEKAKLMRKAGIRHTAQFGGCLLLILQMPILMGLYYCLQESVFFRLEPFLWMPNLAAPDMLLWWSESIPLISDPENRFSFLSFLYLGPYFNLLPLGAVALFWVQQKLTMPPPTDEMQEQQQKMMKYMLIFSALFFYKVAGGLCVYFIVSGLWSLAERMLIPKPKVKLPEPGEEKPKPTGWLARKREELARKMEEVQKQAQAQRQIRNEPRPDLSNLSRAERRAAKRKKK